MRKKDILSFLASTCYIIFVFSGIHFYFAVQDGCEKTDIHSISNFVQVYDYTKMANKEIIQNISNCECESITISMLPIL